MNPPVFRITGLTEMWDPDLGKKVMVRHTVRRAGGSLAYYESREEANRGLSGLKGSRYGSFYSEFLIEQCSGDWRTYP